MAVRESWLATEQEVVGQVHGLVDLLDETILEACGGGIAERIVDSLGSWDPSETQRDLALWRDEAAARFRRDATFRWRRSSTEQLLDRTSWKVGVNPNVQVPRRVARVMKPNLGKAVSEVHERLVSIANAAVVQRRAAWMSSIERAGSFKPGELLTASDALSGR
jgi:hypothetical protein